MANFPSFDQFWDYGCEVNCDDVSMVQGVFFTGTPLKVCSFEQFWDYGCEVSCDDVFIVQGVFFTGTPLKVFFFWAFLGLRVRGLL